MEVTGKIKQINPTQTIGANGFRKRELIVETSDQYPQFIKIEFNQDKCDLLNEYKDGQNVKVNINLKGREWTNPQGETVYFNTIQGWRIEAEPSKQEASTDVQITANLSSEDEPYSLPF